MILTKDQILSGSSRRTEDIKAFGGTVRLMEMTGNMRDEYETYLLSNISDDKPKMVRATLLVYSIVDEDGNLIFDSSDIESLGNKPIHDLQKLYNSAIKLNALSDDDLEALEGNSESGQSENSTTT